MILSTGQFSIREGSTTASSARLLQQLDDDENSGVGSNRKRDRAEMESVDTNLKQSTAISSVTVLVRKQCPPLACTVAVGAHIQTQTDVSAADGTTLSAVDRPRLAVGYQTPSSAASLERDRYQPSNNFQPTIQAQPTPRLHGGGGLGVGPGADPEAARLRLTGMALMGRAGVGSSLHAGVGSSTGTPSPYSGTRACSEVFALKVVRFDDPKLGLVLSKGVSAEGMETAIVRSKDSRSMQAAVSQVLCVGDLLVMVDGAAVAGLSFSAQLEMVKQTHRPLILGFSPGVTAK